MSDYTDYENNLAFAPTSADDLNEQHRQSDVLIEALNKCEKLEAENKRLKSLLRECKIEIRCMKCAFPYEDFTELFSNIDRELDNENSD